MRAELIHASDLLRRNTSEAVAEAIGLLQNTVYSFSMKMCGHREDAEDTTQEVLFRSLKHLPKLQSPSALAAWLYTVARNRCHRLRGVADESLSHKLSLDELMPDEQELKELLLDPAASPEGNLLLAEEGHLLHQAVLRIPTPLRLALVLHDMEELSTDQVAQILGVSEGTVRVRLHRARLALRKEMALILKGAPSTSSGPKLKKAARKHGPAEVPRSKECRELFASLSEYLDGKLNPERCEEISAHIAGCPACVAFLRDLRAAIDRCRSLEVECDPAVATRLQTILTQEYLRLLGKDVPTSFIASAQ